MSRPSKRIRKLETINPLLLAHVIGGRFAPRTTLDPVLLQGFQALAQAVGSVGQSMAAAKQSSMQQMMQMFEQMMQRGGPPRGARR